MFKRFKEWLYRKPDKPKFPWDLEQQSRERKQQKKLENARRYLNEQSDTYNRKSSF